MPLYEYQCTDCQARDQRLAGLDDHTALCVRCGSLMLRLDEDLFGPYFQPPPIPKIQQPQNRPKAKQPRGFLYQLRQHEE